MRVGIYMGSFDPVTNGHLDIMKRSFAFCDELILAVGVNPAKKTLFSKSQRINILNSLIESEFKGKAIRVAEYNMMSVDFAKQEKASILIRGIRSATDFDFEMNLATYNKMLAPEIETVLLPSSPELSMISSSAVKELAKYGKDVSALVPSSVSRALKSVLAND